MPSRFLVPLTLLGFLAACSTTVSDERVSDAIRHGRFAEAVELAEERVAEQPGDPARELHLSQAKVAQALGRGRRALFDGNAEFALQIFYSALELDPQSPAAATWIRKTRNELAEDWLDKAQGITAGDELDAAEEAFENVLAYVLPIGGRDDPAHWIQSQARIGLSRVLLRKNYRLGQSQTYYQSGVNSLREYFLSRAENDFGKSAKFGGGPEVADRRNRVGVLLAEERLAQARELESVGLYFAARNEYRLVLLLEPGNVAAKKGLDRMDRETRAGRSLSKAEMSLLRGAFDETAGYLDEAGRLTTAQVDEVSLLNSKLKDARLRMVYEEGLLLERDYRYVEAVATYDRLLATAEFYEDTIARRKAIQSLIEDAGTLWAQAEAATSEEEEYRLYWEIQHIVWPEFRDVEERLGVLRAKGIGPEEVDLTSAPEKKDWTPSWSGGRGGSDGNLPAQRAGPQQPQRGRRRTTDN